MPHPVLIGRHVVSERDVAVLRLDSVQTAFEWEDRKGHHFACLCAMDARAVGGDELRSFCLHLLRIGCAYFCAWGPDCERVHDTMDAEIVGDDPPATYIGGCVMTTWHTDESLQEVLEFFFDWTTPDEEYAPDGCASALIITAGSALWAEEIERFAKAVTTSAAE
jgi:hypothetical protein